jgi:membrane protein
MNDSSSAYRSWAPGDHSDRRSDRDTGTATSAHRSEDRREPEGREGKRPIAGPTEIPIRNWRDILLRIYRKIGKDRIIAIAAGVAYYSILAIFPAIGALVAIYGLFADPAAIAAHVDSLSGVVPGGVADVMRDEMTQIASHGKSTLGIAFGGGLLVSLWSANAGVKALFDALNVVYEEEEMRGLIGLNLASLCFTALSIVFVIVAIGAVIVLPAALSYLGLGGETDLIIKLGRWPVLFVVVALALALLYRFGASRTRPKWRWITWGSAFATLAWIAASALFSWYAASFGSYNQTYGSLGAAMGFLVWLWLSAIAVLLGAVLDVEMEREAGVGGYEKHEHQTDQSGG